jgi:hypothetical protein
VCSFDGSSALQGRKRMDLPRFGVTGASPFRKVALLMAAIVLLGGFLLATAVAGSIFANSLCANCRGTN